MERTTYRGEGKMIRKNGGVGQHGHVILEMYGLPREGGFVFENNVKGGEIPSEYLTDIRNGVQEAMQEGVVAGFPVIDVGVTLLGGSYHEVDSSGNDFKLAAKLAFKDACSKAPMTILEPIGSLEVRVPSEHIGAVIGDLSRRRAKIKNVSEEMVEAEVPVAETFGYATDLRSITQGRGVFVMSPAGYGETPNVAREQLIAAYN